MGEPKNIFELINQNIVDLSKDVVTMYEKVDAVYKALYPNDSEPNASGTGVEDM